VRLVDVALGGELVAGAPVDGFVAGGGADVKAKRG
jgi:hypothetical protein